MSKMWLILYHLFVLKSQVIKMKNKWFFNSVKHWFLGNSLGGNRIISETNIYLVWHWETLVNIFTNLKIFYSFLNWNCCLSYCFLYFLNALLLQKQCLRILPFPLKCQTNEAITLLPSSRCLSQIFSFIKIWLCFCSIFKHEQITFFCLYCKLMHLYFNCTLNSIHNCPQNVMFACMTSPYKTNTS